MFIGFFYVQPRCSIPIETKIVPLKQNASRCYWNKKSAFSKKKKFLVPIEKKGISCDSDPFIKKINGKKRNEYLLTYLQSAYIYIVKLNILVYKEPKIQITYVCI